MAGSTAILAVRIIGDAAGAQKSFKQAEGAADKFASGLGKLKDKTDMAGLAAGAALTKGLFDAVSADSANRKLAGQLNLSAADAEAAGKLSGKLYTNAYGDSLEQVNGAISAVGSTLTTMTANGGADVERLSKKALDMAATFDTDVAESVNTAGILMKSGLAKDGDEAFDLLVGSMQKMPAAMRAELLPVMDEYSKDFAALGIDGTTAFGIITEASKGGAIMMDKSGDALKEFLILATSGDKPVADAFKSIGLNAEDMATKIAAGGPGAADAFAKTVAGLQSIEDPAAQAQAAIALFGTPLEDLGANKVPEFLGAIDPAGDAFDDLAGSATKLGDTVSTGPGVALETFSRSALASLQSVAAGALPVIQPVIDILMQFAPILGPAAVAIAAVAAVVWLVNAAMIAWNAALLIGKGAVVVSTAAQWAWNAAMSANPIGLVILLVAALVAGIIWAYQNVGWFKDAVDNMGAAAAIVWQAIVTAIEGLIGWLDDLLAPIGGIDGAIAAVGTAGEIAFGNINAAIQGTIKWVQDAIGWFQSLFGAKNDAAGAGGPVGNADGGAMPLMQTQGLLAAPQLMGTQSLMGTSSLTGTASLASTSASLGSLSSGGLNIGGGTTVNITVKADATTDGVQLGKQLVRTINKALTAQGSPRLATV